MASRFLLHVLVAPWVLEYRVGVFEAVTEVVYWVTWIREVPRLEILRRVQFAAAAPEWML